MSLFSKVGKVLKKAAPIVATVASFIPATAPFAVAAKAALGATKVGGLIAKGAKIVSTAQKIGAVAGAIRRPSPSVGTTAMIPSGIPRRQIQLPPVGTGVTNMSILGGLGSIAGKVAGRSLPGIGATAVTAGRSVISAGRGLIQRYPRSARVLRDLGLFAVGGLVYDAAGNLVGQRAPARRINPMNVKAMRRAIRRVKSGKKICAEIDRMLPKRRASAPMPFTRSRARRKC